MSFANKFHHSAEIFADDVELNVHHCALANKVEVGVVEGVGDDCHAERVALGVAYGEAHAVDCHRAFLNGDVPLPRHLGGDVVTETENVASVGLDHLLANGGSIYVPLNNMSVKTSVEAHAALDIHFVAHF